MKHKDTGVELFFGIAGIVVLAIAIRGFMAGRMTERGNAFIVRDNNPVAFWLVFALQLVVGLGMICLAAISYIAS